MNDEFLEAAHKGIPLSDYRAERLAHLEAENERLKAAIKSLLTDEHWCDYFEGKRADYHICWFCGAQMVYGDDFPPIDEFPHAPNCVALVAYKLIQGE
jgi:hypothetical protein